MAEKNGTPSSSGVGYLTEADQMSLRESREQQTGTSHPDSLEVRGDEMSILNDQLATWRRPARIVVGVLAVGLAIVVVGGLLTRRGSTPA